MYQISFEEHKLVVNYTIMKFSRTILREIYIKSVGEEKFYSFFKHYHKIEVRRLPDNTYFS